MKRLLSVSIIASLLMMGASISWAETATVKSSKSHGSDRMGGSGESKGKGAKSTAPPATQDPCASVKNDPVQFAKCQDATHPVGLSKRSGGKRGY